MKTFKLKPVPVILLCLVLLGSIAACRGSGTRLIVNPPAAEGSSPDTAVSEKQNNGNLDFGFNLYRELVKDKPENSLISPVSISLALSMALNGAAGDTEKAMSRALGWEGVPLGTINSSNKSFVSSLNRKDSGVETSIANSIWARLGGSFKKDFFDVNKTYYNAGLQNLDFSSPDAANTINSWVGKNTGGKINKIVDAPIDINTAVFLVNAVCFKGLWQDKFDPAKTTDQEFTTFDGKAARVRMMHRSGRVDYFNGGDFQAVRLPYGKGDMGMYIFLPDKGSSLGKFYEKLDRSNWVKWTGGFSKQEIDIAIPKFKMEYETNLKDVLGKIGMSIAFDRNKADFSRMLSSPPGSAYIDNVKHKTFIEVKEEGTEAAAATSVEIRLTSAVVNKLNFVADRPFFFAIADSATGAVLFMGSVQNVEE